MTQTKTRELFWIAGKIKAEDGTPVIKLVNADDKAVWISPLTPVGGLVIDTLHALSLLKIYKFEKFGIVLSGYWVQVEIRQDSKVFVPIEVISIKQLGE